MPGSTQPWGQSADPPDNTVDLPRIDPSAATPSAAVETILAGPPAASAQSGQRAEPAAGSLADLRTRLARLPYGHPSSPYDDAGAAKPAAPRLRQLELGLPAPERDRSGGFARAVDPRPTVEHDPLAEFRNGHAPGQAADELTAGVTGPGPDAPPGPAEAKPAIPADHEPAASAPPAGYNGSAPVAARTRAPAPNGTGRARDDLQDPYALPPARNGREQAAGDTGGRPIEPSTSRRSSGNGTKRGNDHQSTAQFGTDWLVADPAAAGPATSVSDPRQHDSPGSQYDELVEQTLATFRAAEGRNMFGSYGDRGITAAIRRVAGQLPHGGLAPDSEADSLKPADRFAAKLARLVGRFPGIPAEELAASITDGVRYAFTFEPPDYSEGTWLVHRKLKAQGFELESRRNRWESPECKGIWTRWRDPAHDQVFEVQFHTTVSWAVRQRTHDSYVRITDPRTSPAERARLRTRQVAAAAAAVPPPGCMEIGEFRLEPR